MSGALHQTYIVLIMQLLSQLLFCLSQVKIMIDIVEGEISLQLSVFSFRMNYNS